MLTENVDQYTRYVATTSVTCIRSSFLHLSDWLLVWFSIQWSGICYLSSKSWQYHINGDCNNTQNWCKFKYVITIKYYSVQASTHFRLHICALVLWRASTSQISAQPRQYPYCHVFCCCLPGILLFWFMTDCILPPDTHCSEAIPTDVWRKPLCMSQLDIYGKCRVPYPEVDKIRHTPISESKHIVVIRNGHVKLKFKHTVIYYSSLLMVTLRTHIMSYYCSSFAWTFCTSVQMGLGLWLLPPTLLNSYTTLSKCPLTPLRVQLEHWPLSTGTLGPRTERHSLWVSECIQSSATQSPHFLLIFPQALKVLLLLLGIE